MPKKVAPDEKWCKTIQRECANNCGWSADPNFPTCCKRCTGARGPHSPWCAKKNQRISLQVRMQLLSIEEQEKEAEHMKNAVEECKNTTSGTDLLDALQVLVADDWLPDQVALEGNIYRAYAFGFMPKPKCKDFFKLSIWSQATYMGAVFIWFVQILGPAVLLVNGLWTYDEWKIFSFGPWRPDKHFGRKFLGLFLIILFNLNTLATLERDASSWEKLSLLFGFCGAAHKKNTHLAAMYVGACSNCYVFITSCCCTCLLLGQAEGPKDVLFDAMGMLFLFYLDDIGANAQVGFLDEKSWPGERLGWLYEQMILSDDLPAENKFLKIYKVTRWILIVLFILLPLCYTVTDFNQDEAAEL